MNKNRLILVGALVLGTLAVVPVKGQLDREAMERARMKGSNVKVCEQYTHKYVKGEPKAEGYLTTKTTYDK